MDQEQEDLHHHEDNNMQVGFVELIESAADLVFTSIFRPMALQYLIPMQMQ